MFDDDEHHDTSYYIMLMCSENTIGILIKI